MIITNVCLLMEALSIVVCLHYLYGKKFKLDIYTVSFLSIDMILMTVINYYGLPKNISMIIYPILALYCGKRFGFRLKKLVVNMVLCIVITGGLQMVVSFLMYHLFHIKVVSDIQLVITSCMSFVLMLAILQICKIASLSYLLQHKEKISIFIISVCIVILLFWLIGYRKIRFFNVNEALMLFGCIILMIVLVGQVSKYKIKSKEIETDLKMSKLYSTSFQGLIDHIRLRQHEFDNHINTIYSLHYIHNNYEDLVKAQSSYCKLVVNDNRFNKLLSGGNPVIVGFLYGKFVEIEKLGIDIKYKVVGVSDDLGMPMNKVVEILGDLMNNAVEALVADEERNKLYVSVIGVDGLKIEVKNESPLIDHEDMKAFFKRGYSGKGENRGLGLYNVKLICEEYHMEIICGNEKIDGVNWMCFDIHNQKETI